MAPGTRAPSILLLLLLALAASCTSASPASSHESSEAEATPAQPPDVVLPPEETDPPGRPAPRDGGTPAADDHDTFGTRHLYPSAPRGRTWASRWDAHPRTLKPGQQDPYDAEFQLRGTDHTLEIFGDGTARSSGEMIRFYIGTPDKRWLNTELTVYAMRMLETSRDPGSAGFELQTRTGDGHQENAEDTAAGLDRRCDGHAYAYSLRFDGRALLEKELKHPTYTPQLTKLLWGGGPMPRNKWVGIKAITYNLPGERVKLELWLDLTDGVNGGTWKKVHEHTDAGGWSIDPAVAATCQIPADHRLTRPEPFVILRSHGIREQWYKKVTVREIQPPSR